MSAPIPFEDPNKQGKGSANGVVRLDGTELVVEFRVKRGHVRAETEVQTLHLTLGETGLELQKKWFRTYLVIQAARMADVEDFPGAKAGRLVLQIPRKYRQAVRDLMEEARAKALDRKIAEMRKEVDDLARS